MVRMSAPGDAHTGTYSNIGTSNFTEREALRPARASCATLPAELHPERPLVTHSCRIPEDHEQRGMAGYMRNGPSGALPYLCRTANSLLATEAVRKHVGSCASSDLLGRRASAQWASRICRSGGRPRGGAARSGPSCTVGNSFVRLLLADFGARGQVNDNFY
jgi:hypothetical protein